MRRFRTLPLLTLCGLLLAATAHADRDTPGRPKPPAGARPPAPSKPAAKTSTTPAKTDRPSSEPKKSEPKKDEATSGKVQRDGIAVMGGPGSFYPKLGDLVRGSRVDIVSEHGPWIEVTADQLKGFIPRSALDAKQPGNTSLAGAYGSNKASASSQTAAVKGFNEDVERAHAQNRGEDWSGVEWIDRQVVTPEQMQAFLVVRGLWRPTP